MKSKKLIVPESYQGRRLDQTLELLMPGVGRRGRKRIWEKHRVEVNGRPQEKGFRVSRGQEISLVAGNDPGRSGFALEDWPDVRIIKEKSGYAALYKPAGLHTAVLESRSEPSLEQGLDVLFSSRAARLLNRLDRPTSGLVLAALRPEAAKRYLQLQLQGKVLKYYLAVCRGRLDKETEVGQRILSEDRKVVRVLAEKDPDPLRWSLVTPLATDRSRELTLVRVRIFKGARHQIRAHLAWLGFPLAGDPLYGRGTEANFRLQHYKIEFPGFLAELEPDWNITGI
ncbi:MAG: pseudouridine synthase family protein [Thermodesulfobacteriota bacterium]